MKSVILTGSEGTVGRVLTGRSLAEDGAPQLRAEITRLDIQEDRGGTTYPFIQIDLADYEQLKQLLQKHDVVIHAAWTREEGILRPNGHDPRNQAITEQILRCAEKLSTAAPIKVILFSSVNAHVPEDWRERRDTGKFIHATEAPQPNQHNRDDRPGRGTTRYGESKIAIEEAARQAAAHGVHVVVVHLGGVNLRDKQPSGYEPYQAIYQDPEKGAHFDAGIGGWEDAVHLRHIDFVDHIQQLIDAPIQPGTFELYNLVSDGPHRVHEIM